MDDTLVFSFGNREQARDFVRLINDRGIQTKNVPDAIEWHFAKYWGHIFGKFGSGRQKLAELTRPSAEILDRSVAIPIMVKMKLDQVLRTAQILHDSVRKIAA